MKSANEVQRAYIAGAGVMGVGIAQTFAQHGLQVKVRDISPDFLQRAQGKLREVLDSRVARGKMTAAEVDELMGRIQWTTDLEAFADAEVVVEAVPENMDLKRSVFAELDRICSADAILMTNTSTMSPTAIGAATRRPEQVIGVHFMNPAPVTKLVEVVPGLLTAPETVAFARAFAQRLGKESVLVQDSPGGITSRLMVALRNEAIRIYSEGVASAEDIDKTMTLGSNFPMGPLTLVDLVGVDVHYNNAMAVAREMGPQYLPPPLVKKMVDAGLLGRKSGRGFFDYTKKDGGKS